MVDERRRYPTDVLQAIERDALLNAVKHDGKADVGAVMSRVLGDIPSLRADPKSTASEVKTAVTKVNSMTSQEQEELLESKYPGALAVSPRTPEERRLPPLKSAVKGATCFRIPPEPSGFMTIGHAMAFTINSIYKEMYDGVLWLRFEDTNPKKVSSKYYDSFRKGIEWLGIKCDHEKSLSEDMDVFYEFGRRMVSEGLAYACSCAADRVKKLRFEGTECEHRRSSESASLRVWDQLLEKKYREGEFVIRFRGDMKSLDYSLRDPNLFRVIEHSHPVTGDRFVLWPTYDLANAIEDHICGVTHILRSSEFHTELQQRLRESLKLRPLEVIQFSRFNFKGSPVHKRLLRPLVENNLVTGWDDPRMPTVEGVKRRGILPETLRQFTVQVGYTKTEHEYEWSLLFSLNRKLLDPKSRRMFFVPDPVEIHVESAPPRNVSIPFHPENDLGSRTIETHGRFFVPSKDLREMKEGSKFRLMDLFTVVLTKGLPSPAAEYLGDELSPEIKKVQWVTESHLEAVVRAYDLLYDSKEQFISPGVTETKGFGEEAVKSVSMGEIVQFPRVGFCRLDSPSTFVLADE